MSSTLNFGVYLGLPAASPLYDPSLLSAESDLGVTSTVIDEGINTSAAMSTWVAQFASIAASFVTAPGGTSDIPDLSLPMVDGTGTLSELQTFQQIASGADDSIWEGIVNTYKADGYTTLYIRPGWEMNGTWYNWSISTQAEAQAYIAAFDRISEIVQSIPGINVQVIWNPNTSDSSAVPTQDMYPGNAYVDVIGLDFYDALYPYSLYDWSTGTYDTTIQQWWSNPVNLAHYWNYPDATAAEPDGSGNEFGLAAAEAFAVANDKPFALPETGDSGNGTTTGPLSDPYFPQYLAQALLAPGTAPLALLSIWDKYATSAQFSDGANPVMAAAWAAFVDEVVLGGAGPSVSAAAIAVPSAATTNLLAALEALITPIRAGDTETISAVSAALGTVVLGSGNAVLYTAGASGIDVIRYTVTDQRGDSTVAATVIDIDPGPTITPATVAVAHGQTYSLASLTAGLITPGLPGDSESLSQVQALEGSLGTASSGQPVYTAPGSGTDLLSYTVTDQLGDSVAGSTTIEVDPGPVLTPGSGAAVTGVSVNLTSAIAALIAPGLPGDVEKVTAISAARGSVSLRNGSITYTPPASGRDTLTYTVQDQLGDTATGTDTITVDSATIDGKVSRLGVPGDPVWGSGDPGVTVSLLDATGSVVATQTSSAIGWFAFYDLLPGIYSLAYAAPANQVLQTARTVANAPFSAPAETNVTRPNVYFRVMASLGGQVLLAGSGQAGTTVQLLNLAGSVLQTAVTDAAGSFVFDDLAAGSYQVRILPPDGEVVPGGGLSAVVTLAAAQAGSLPATVLVAAAAAISGSVLAGGTGRSGVTVRLFDASGNLLQSTSSAADGSFAFTNLVAGSYAVGYTAPAGAVLQTGGPATNGSGMTAAMNVAAGQTVSLAPEQLLTQPATISSSVAHLGGATDPVWGGPDAGVTVSLLDAAGDVLATTLTASNGWYIFRALAAGIYQVSIVAPAGQEVRPGPSSVIGTISVAAGAAVVIPVVYMVSAVTMNGAGLAEVMGDGSYVVTGNASTSTLTLGQGNQQVTLTGTADTVVTGNGNQSISLSGTGNIITVGTGTSTIMAGSGGSVVHAAGGTVRITAAGSGNLLDAGTGLGYIYADGSGGNVFLLNAAGATALTRITGFNAAGGDTLDLARTLAGTAILPDLSNLASFISATVSGGSTWLSAVPAGGGAAQHFAELVGVQTSVAALQAAHDFSLA